MHLGTRRRRECRKCQHRYTTYELPLLAIIATEAPQPVEAPEIPDAYDIAEQVVEQIGDQITDRLDALPQETVDALILEAESRHEAMALTRTPLELEAGDDPDNDDY